MENLKNNIMYNLSRLLILGNVFASVMVCLLRIVFPLLSRLSYFTGSYIVWMFMNAGYATYLNNLLPATLIKLITSCSLFILIYLALYIGSKKSVSCMIGALCYYTVDSLLFAYESYYIRSTEFFVVGVIFKAIVIIGLIMGVYYGFVGREIELFADKEEVDLEPDIRFTDFTFSYDLTEINRTVTFTREKSFIMSYIYIEVIIDGRHCAYLKSGESATVELDGNRHLIEIVSRYALIKTYAIDLPQGNESKDYNIAINFNKAILKKINVTENV